MQKKNANRIVATVDCRGESRPKELHVKFRLPVQNTLADITVNGQKAQIGGLHKDTAIFAAGQAKHFEVVAEFS
jgi:hypothetical protein